MKTVSHFERMAEWLACGLLDWKLARDQADRVQGAQCIQSPVDLSSFDPASLQILQRLEDLENNLYTAIRENVGNEPRPRALSYGSRNAESSPKLDRSLLLPPQPEELYDIVEFDQQRRPLASLLKSAERQLSSPELSAHGSSMDADLEGPTCKRLLDQFFLYVHVKNPILKEDEARRLVHHISMTGLDWSAHSCLVLLICALGATASPFGPSESVAPGTTAFALGEAYFSAARKRLGLCLIDGNLLSAQCLFLAGVYLVGVFQPYDSWRLFSQALACCQAFEFDTPATDPDQSPAASYLSPDEAAKQSIYWSAWKSEREARAAFDMRDFPASSQDIYPFFFPTPPLSSADSGSVDDIQTRERLGWYFYLTEISLHRLNMRKSNEALYARAEPGQSIYSALADALPGKKDEVESWLNALPSPVSLSTHPKYDDVCKFVLRCHLQNFYEMIYWPFVARYIFTSKQDSIHSPQVSVPTEDARLRDFAEAGLSLHVERIRVNAPGFAHRHHGTWILIRACTRSALVLLKAALIASSSGALSMPTEWLEAVREVIQLNQYWQGEVLDARLHLSVLEKAIAMV